MRSLLLFTLSLFIGGIIGCSTTGSAKKGKGEPVFYAVAVIQPTKGNKAHGTVWFAEQFGRVKVTADLKGLTPEGKHGFHVHEFGDCTASDATSAGGHYNPDQHPHAGPHSEGPRHAGDLGNVVADKKGEAKLEIEIENVSVAGTVNPLIGRAVIVHSHPDDLMTQPTGGAGARIGCGVIGAAAKK